MKGDGRHIKGKKPDLIARNKSLGLIICVAFAAFIVNVDNYIVNIALPTITAYFDIDTSMASWIPLAYVITIVSTMLLIGKIADRFGIKKIFILGYALFTLGSLLCGLSPMLSALIFSRVVQGLGGSMLYIGGFAVVAKFLPPEKKGWGFGILSMAAGLGLMLSTPIGGFITECLSWHWVFIVNVPIGIASILISRHFIPSDTGSLSGHTRKKFDIIGAALSIIMTVSFVFALNRASKIGWFSPIILTCFSVAMAGIILFIFWERRHEEPIIDFKVFRNKIFITGTIQAFSAYFFFAGSNFLLPFYLEGIKGLTTSQTGFTMMVYSLVYITTSPFAGRMSDRINPEKIIHISIFSGAAASLFFASMLSREGIYSTFIYLIWLALSLAFFFSPNNNIVMQAVRGEHKGVATGVFRTSCHFGILLGVCLYEMVFSYTIHMAGVTGNPLSMGYMGLNAAVLSGFRNAYLFGGFIGLVAFILSVIRKKGVYYGAISNNNIQ
ncbi:MAG TPA: DHA2 family efflux MFS transporter permease subunit [Syntrophorhabdaceae bacterium]|nr:DHA2 family efflux MFS transporter permease subunit [Syntrophorhabdaceae bacterium]